MTANVESGQRIRAAHPGSASGQRIWERHKGAVVFVTGAGRGIGRTIAARLSV